MHASLFSKCVVLTSTNGIMCPNASRAKAAHFETTEACILLSGYTHDAHWVDRFLSKEDIKEDL